ncbi:MAG: FadR family transcriptional regulator [Lentisphaeria bacterium]|nr:FadR family transcriptional regulator [Lentisphaeria bacterium]
MGIQKKSKKNTLSCTIDAIGNYIRDNKLKEGAPLPTELELSSRLGVSRSILREALRHFRTLGIITSKSKTGSKLEKLFPSDPYQSYRPFLIRQPGILPKLIQLRGIIESGSAELIVMQATAERIEAMKKFNRQLREARKLADRTMADCLFHSELLRCVENPFVDNLIPLFSDFFQQVMSTVSGSIKTKQEDIVKEHERIIACIEKKDSAGVRAMLCVHNQANVDFVSDYSE